MRHCSVDHKVSQVPAISLRKPLRRDRRKNRFDHHHRSQLGKLTEERDERILTGDQVFASPNAYPTHQSKSKDGVTQNTFGRTHFCGVQTEPDLDIGKELFDGPPPREAFDDLFGFEVQIGRRQVGGFAFAFQIANDHHAELNTGLGPPSDKGLAVEGYEFAVDLDANPFPSTARVPQGFQTWQTATVLGFAPSFLSLFFGKRLSQDRIETQTAGQKNLHPGQRFENRLVVVSPVGDKGNLEGNPGLDLLECLDRNLQARTKLGLRTVFLGTNRATQKGKATGTQNNLTTMARTTQLCPQM
jgi:hypothetical protein